MAAMASAEEHFQFPVAHSVQSEDGSTEAASVPAAGQAAETLPSCGQVGDSLEVSLAWQNDSIERCCGLR